MTDENGNCYEYMAWFSFLVFTKDRSVWTSISCSFRSSSLDLGVHALWGSAGLSANKQRSPRHL